MKTPTKPAQSKPRKLSKKLRWRQHAQGQIDQYGRIFDARGKFVGCGYATH